LLNSKYIGSYASLLINNYISVGMMYNKTVLRDSGGWNEELKLEDHEFWLRLSKFQKFAYTNTVVSKYRFHEQNSHNIHKYELLKNNLEIMIHEKKYINDFNTQKEWREGYNISLLSLLLSKQFNLFYKYYKLGSDFEIYVITKIIRKVFGFFNDK